ncbi:hypothetical protein WAI453_000195 [Rhynchosporium graminicola]
MNQQPFQQNKGTGTGQTATGPLPPRSRMSLHEMLNHDPPQQTQQYALPDPLPNSHTNSAAPFNSLSRTPSVYKPSTTENAQNSIPRLPEMEIYEGHAAHPPAPPLMSVHNNSITNSS